MIRYIKYQNKNSRMMVFGKWYLRAIYEEIVDIDKLADHMASHNTPYSRGIIRGILTDAVSCIKELMLDGKAVKLQDLALFRIGLISNGADTAEEAKASLVTGFRFNAKGTGEMSVTALKQEIRLKELKQYTGGEPIGDDELDDDPENDPENDSGNDNDPGNDPGNDNDPNGGDEQQATTYSLTFKHNDEVMEVRQYAEGATVSAPEPPSGYVWTDLPTTMPARDLVVTTVSEGGDSGEI